MEKKIKDKLDIAWELVREKEEKHNAEWNEFIKEWYTPEINEMVNVITDKTGNWYKNQITDDIKVYLGYNKVDIFSKHSCVKTRVEKLKPISEYNDYTISEIERHAIIVEQSNKAMSTLKDHILEVIEDITQQYKNITEGQTDRINGVFKLLDVEEEPIKHIKVTVEWI